MQKITNEDVVHYPPIPNRPWYINDIFKTKYDKKKRIGKNVAKNALMNQDILVYARRHPDGFKFTDLGNWLLDKNDEFHSEYSAAPASHTPRNKRLHIKRNRIQRHLDLHIRAGLLKKKSIVKSKKNELDTGIYQLTLPGYFLTWLLDTTSRWVENTSSRRLEAEQNIVGVIETYLKVKDSYMIRFIYQFFRNCGFLGAMGLIINYFITKIIPIERIEDGHQLIRLFLGLDNCTNWILFDPEAFLGTINQLDNESKKMVLFKLKMEIEEYHEKNYLTHEWQRWKLITDVTSNVIQTNHCIKMSPDEQFAYQNSPYENRIIIGIPSGKWQETRFNHCSDYTKVALPGICQNCLKEEPFVINIFEYFNCVISSKGPYPNDVVSGKCSNCGMYSTSCMTIQLSYYINELDIYCVTTKNDNEQ